MDNSHCCDRFEEQVQSLMDRRVLLKDDPQLQRHTDECESCRRLLENFLAFELTLNKVFPADRVGVADELFSVDGSVSRESDGSGIVNRPAELDSFAFRASGKNKRAARWGAVVSVLAAAVVLFLLVPNWLVGEGSVAGIDSGDVVVALDSGSLKAVSNRKQSEEIQLSSTSESGVNRFGMLRTLPVSLRNAYGYAAELPGVRPLECSVNVTIEMLQRSFDRFSGDKQIDEENPDLGYFDHAWQIRTV